jgi:hypothetical protein
MMDETGVRCLILGGRLRASDKLELRGSGGEVANSCLSPLLVSTRNVLEFVEVALGGLFILPKSLFQTANLAILC